MRLSKTQKNILTASPALFSYVCSTTYLKWTGAEGIFN